MSSIFTIDTQKIELAIGETKGLEDCQFISSNLRVSVDRLVDVAKEYIQLKKKHCGYSLDSVNVSITTLKDEIDRLQARLSDVDDIMSDVYSAMEDASNEIDGLMGEEYEH